MLSPAQRDRIEDLHGRFPHAVSIEIESVDLFSSIATVEIETLDGFAYVPITASGRIVRDSIACGWAATR